MKKHVKHKQKTSPKMCWTKFVWRYLTSHCKKVVIFLLKKKSLLLHLSEPMLCGFITSRRVTRDKGYKIKKNVS